MLTTLLTVLSVAGFKGIYIGDLCKNEVMDRSLDCESGSTCRELLQTNDSYCVGNQDCLLPNNASKAGYIIVAHNEFYENGCNSCQCYNTILKFCTEIACPQTPEEACFQSCGMEPCTYVNGRAQCASNCYFPNSPSGVLVLNGEKNVVRAQCLECDCNQGDLMCEAKSDKCHEGYACVYNETNYLESGCIKAIDDSADCTTYPNACKTNSSCVASAGKSGLECQPMCFHDGKPVIHGDSIQVDCNKCVCVSGFLACDRKLCPPKPPIATMTLTKCSLDDTKQSCSDSSQQCFYINGLPSCIDDVCVVNTPVKGFIEDRVTVDTGCLKCTCDNGKTQCKVDDSLCPPDQLCFDNTNVVIEDEEIKNGCMGVVSLYNECKLGYLNCERGAVCDVMTGKTGTCVPEEKSCDLKFEKGSEVASFKIVHGSSIIINQCDWCGCSKGELSCQNTINCNSECEGIDCGSASCVAQKGVPMCLDGCYFDGIFVMAGKSRRIGCATCSCSSQSHPLCIPDDDLCEGGSLCILRDNLITSDNPPSITSSTGYLSVCMNPAAPGGSCVTLPCPRNHLCEEGKCNSKQSCKHPSPSSDKSFVIEYGQRAVIKCQVCDCLGAEVNCSTLAGCQPFAPPNTPTCTGLKCDEEHCEFTDPDTRDFTERCTHCYDIVTKEFKKRGSSWLHNCERRTCNESGLVVAEFQGECHSCTKDSDCLGEETCRSVYDPASENKNGTNGTCTKEMYCTPPTITGSGCNDTDLLDCLQVQCASSSTCVHNRCELIYLKKGERCDPLSQITQLCPKGTICTGSNSLEMYCLGTNDPCTFEGVTYKSGEVRPTECSNNCQCDNGFWECTNFSCIEFDCTSSPDSWSFDKKVQCCEKKGICVPSELWGVCRPNTHETGPTANDWMCPAGSSCEESLGRYLCVDLCSRFIYPEEKTLLCTPDMICPDGYECDECVSSKCSCESGAVSECVEDCRMTCTVHKDPTNDDKKYDCMTPSYTWSVDQRDYCWENHKLGGYPTVMDCRIPEADLQLLHATNSTYDLPASEGNWFLTSDYGVTIDWASGKKNFCCQNFAAACRSQLEDVFDCTWDATTTGSWSEPRRRWCCAVKGVRCPYRPKNSTAIPLSSRLNVGTMCGKEGLGESEKMWCCEHIGLQCDIQEKAASQCSLQVVNSTSTCCGDLNVGCIYDCGYGEAIYDMSKEGLDYCCSVKGVCFKHETLYESPPPGSSPDSIRQYRMLFAGSWNLIARNPKLFERRLRRTLLRAIPSLQSSEENLKIRTLGALMANHEVPPHSLNWRLSVASGDKVLTADVLEAFSRFPTGRSNSGIMEVPSPTPSFISTPFTNMMYGDEGVFVEFTIEVCDGKCVQIEQIIMP
eukprot:TRINITY_DN6538_c2_g1_i1.p1 TRINITY_DN6538_c2_g1~~TRINITY_DN6538_c2_g1_i1.p1  ORF type:complete len:1366 (+),score=192.43 TRINITY_DN6538_c2_g1_i1:35-4132(+)